MQARALYSAAAASAVVAWLAVVPAARAQDVRVTAPAPPLAGDGQKPLTPDENDLLSRALLFDPAALASDKPARTLKHASLRKPAVLDVKGNDKPDGSSSVAVKQPLTVAAPDIDSSVGADVNLAAQQPTFYQPGKPLPGAVANDTGSAAAWASIGMANLASIDARVDPSADQGKLGGKLSHSMPVGQQLSVTLEDSYSVTETFNPGATAAAPVTTATLAGPPPVTPTPQVFGNSRSVKLNVAPTGTSFGAGWTTASNDPVTHNTLSADQKLFGPLHVTTSLTDVGQPTENKSITAGLKFDW